MIVRFSRFPLTVRFLRFLLIVRFLRFQRYTNLYLSSQWGVAKSGGRRFFSCFHMLRIGFDL